MILSVLLFLIACPHDGKAEHPHIPVEQHLSDHPRYPFHHLRDEEWLVRVDCAGCHSLNITEADYEKWPCGPPWQDIPEAFPAYRACTEGGHFLIQSA